MRTLPRKSLTVILALFVSLLGGLRPVYACGPFTREAIFSYVKHPDIPLDTYARGQLGVLQQTYARSYLYAAYRYMNGPGFTEQEQQALISLWSDRLGYNLEDEAVDSSDAWIAARKKITGTDLTYGIAVHRALPDYYSFLNCPQDAFETATKTLSERVTRFGPNSPEVKEWIEGQDIVFMNCGSGENIPDAGISVSAPLIQADRAYQIAAANFYAMKYDEAKTQFEQIANDSSSPWRETAQYLAARSLIRKGSVGDKAHRSEALAEALAHLKRTVAEIKQGPLHDSAAKLLNLVELRLHPAERMAELALTLMRPAANDNLKQDLWDYTILLDQFVGETDEPADESKVKSFKEQRKDDLTDWLLTFQATGADSYAHSLARWRETKSNAWLVSALVKAEAASNDVSTLIEAANTIGPDSPAYATAMFHAVRLRLATGKNVEARQMLDTILNRSQSTLPPSALNQFLHQRMLLATNLEEFLKYAQRTPSAYSWGEDGRELPIDAKEITDDDELKPLVGKTLFDADATRIMNEQFPLAMLKEAAQTPALPEHLRKRIALAVWTRAVMLDETAIAKSITPTLQTLAPEMKALLNDYMAATTPENAKAAALYAILKSPGARPFITPGIGRLTPLPERDIYRDNWWCDRSPDSYDTQAESEEGSEETPKAPVQATLLSLEFLSGAQTTAGQKERARLLSLGTAPNYLAGAVIAWANRAPKDPRVPEALHLSVMATRYGCTNSETGKFSKAAFELLHKRYPTSTWAKQTPYWFNNG